MFPVRCYTCNAVLGHFYDTIEDRRSREKLATVMNSLNINRMCCRRMFIGHVDIINDILRFPNDRINIDATTVLNRRVDDETEASCA